MQLALLGCVPPSLHTLDLTRGWALPALTQGTSPAYIVLHCTWEQYAHSEPAVFLIRVCPRWQNYLLPRCEAESTVGGGAAQAQECLLRASAVKQLAINFKS